MKKVTEETSAGKSEAPASGLDDLIQQGARQIVQQAIEAELASLLERFDNVKTLDGRRTVIRNGYLPEREVVTAIGPVTVKVPKVRDRSGSGVKFNSDIVPPSDNPHAQLRLGCDVPGPRIQADRVDGKIVAGIRAPEKIASLLEGVPFKDGLPVTDSTPAQQPLAA